MHDNSWVPLVDYRRHNIPEVTVHGAIAWFHGKELLHSYGGNVLCYGRSMMKPVQIKVIAHELDPQLSWESKAVSIASHNAETIHIEAVKDILKPSEYGLLQTPHALPLAQFGKQLRRPRRWYHSCSGKHAAIIRACELNNWSRIGYTLPQHPFHQVYMNKVREILGSELQSQIVAKDGCGLPTIAMTVNELARLFADLAVRKDEDWIWEAMIRHPDHIGGFNRLDSTILKSCRGEVIAKEGADGLLGLSIIHPDFKDGLGVVIKVSHGWDPRATWYVARWVLGVLGFDLRNPYPLERQKAHIVNEVIPPSLRANMQEVQAWDDWDPDQDRWYFDPEPYVKGWQHDDHSKLH
ncbi:MAG: asparaginase [Oligoflexus sp.]